MPQRLGHARPIYYRLRRELEGLDALAELVLDRRWSWSSSTAALWRQLDADLWEVTHNPLVILRTTSLERIQCMLADARFRDAVDLQLQEARRAATAPVWFRGILPDAPHRRAAYFCKALSLC